MKVTVLGAGLAGSEAALQLARHGIPVTLVDAKPEFVHSDVYTNPNPAELVCSNSLKSEAPLTGSYFLKEEMRISGCRLLDIAADCQVPAGKSLAVDRARFAEAVACVLADSNHITVVSGRKIETVGDLVNDFPADRYIIAAGPLAHETLLTSLAGEHGSFFDAIAPLVSVDSLDTSRMFRASRWGKGEADFLNVPFTKTEFTTFYDALVQADSASCGTPGEKRYFQRCMPIEEIARRGRKTLLFGPLRPVGFDLPDGNPHAVLQLRTEDIGRTAYNLVGFQTRLKYGAQRSVFRLIPGFENAEFVRYGSMHRNSYISTPDVAGEDHFLGNRPDTIVAGQLSGVEGYNESIWSGMWAAYRIIAADAGVPVPRLPFRTMTGGLMKKLVTPVHDFQPVSANFSVIFNPTKRKGRDRKRYYVENGLETYRSWWRDFSSGII